MAKAAQNNKPSKQQPASAIPGAENRMASAEETRAPGAPGATGATGGGHQYRGERRFVTKIPIVEDGRHHPAKSVIRLTAHRANQLGPDKIAPHQGESYTDTPKRSAKAPPPPPLDATPAKNEGDDTGEKADNDDAADNAH
jgi:hypothetical protein